MKRIETILIIIVCLVLGFFSLKARNIVPASMVALPKSGATLILDAGHGGEDGGALSASGAKESDINLAVVRKLDYILAFCGVESILTRSEDISLHSKGCQTLREKKVSDLKNRVALVNSTLNSMLISVHQNHFTDPAYSGAQVFYNIGDMSRQWGEQTQEHLRQVLDPENRRKAKLMPDSVYLFKHINCPSILVECGFLSNGEEASLLLTDSYQRKVAVALAGACLQQLQIVEGFAGGG